MEYKIARSANGTRAYVYVYVKHQHLSNIYISISIYVCIHSICLVFHRHSLLPPIPSHPGPTHPPIDHAPLFLALSLSLFLYHSLSPPICLCGHFRGQSNSTWLLLLFSSSSSSPSPPPPIISFHYLPFSTPTPNFSTLISIPLWITVLFFCFFF